MASQWMGLDQLLKVFLCTTGMALCHPFAQRASMLQDLERGLKTEVDVINGAVVEKGREYAIETPSTHGSLSWYTPRSGGSAIPHVRCLTN